MERKDLDNIIINRFLKNSIVHVIKFLLKNDNESYWTISPFSEEECLKFIETEKDTIDKLIDIIKNEWDLFDSFENLKIKYDFDYFMNIITDEDGNKSELISKICDARGMID